MDNTQKYNWRDFNKLKKCEEITTYLEGREYSHGQYCHYTSLDIVELILKGRSFQLSCVEKFNDNKDKEIKNSKYKFSICFSTGINENLSLWYMYAGIDGKGCRIRFSKTYVQKLIDKAEYYLVETEKSGKIIDGSEILLKDKSIITKKFKDIIYIDDQMNDLKYNTMTNHDMCHKEIKSYISQNNGFWKQIVWYYEKETRLLIEVDHNLIDSEKYYVIRMTIPETVEFNIDLAPEADEERMKIEDCYPEMWKFILESSNLNPSRYKGQVSMNLCKNNIKTFERYISSIDINQMNEKLKEDIYSLYKMIDKKIKMKDE